jgi:hypothetical protein
LYQRNSGYIKVLFPEKLGLKENYNIKIIVDEEGQLLANGSGNMLAVDRYYRHFSIISIQMKQREIEERHTPALIS